MNYRHREHEESEAETDPWYTYPNGYQYHTPLRKHMKELVNEIIADAKAKGYESTRKRSGPKHVPGSTLLDPIVCSHDPAYAKSQQRCQLAVALGGGQEQAPAQAGVAGDFTPAQTQQIALAQGDGLIGIHLAEGFTKGLARAHQAQQGLIAIHRRGHELGHAARALLRRPTLN